MNDGRDESVYAAVLPIPDGGYCKILPGAAAALRICLATERFWMCLECLPTVRPLACETGFFPATPFWPQCRSAKTHHYEAAEG